MKKEEKKKTSEVRLQLSGLKYKRLKDWQQKLQHGSVGETAAKLLAHAMKDYKPARSKKYVLGSKRST